MPNERTTPTPKNCLARPESRALEDLIQYHKEAIGASSRKPVLPSEFAAQQLGVLVTAANVKTAAGTMGVNFPSRRPSKYDDLAGAVSRLSGRQLSIVHVLRVLLGDDPDRGALLDDALARLERAFGPAEPGS